MADWKRVRSVRRGGWLILAMLTLLSACNFSPEKAVIQEVLGNDEHQKDLGIDADTIQILQTQSRGDDVVVQVVFQVVHDDGQRSECVYEYQAQKGWLEWTAGGGGGGCGPVGGSGEPIGIGSGWNRGEEEGWSRVSGLVYDESIVAVEVVWDDKGSQRVEVVNGGYLAVRDGVHQYLWVQALDVDNQVVYVRENPEAGPSNSKEVP